MSISHLLDDFGAYARGTPIGLTEVSLEEQKLEAFERGYQAGWDDATSTGEEDTRRISADFAQNLQELTFTYEEAFAKALKSLRPLLEQMVSAVLPALAQDTLGLHVTEQLQDMAADQSSNVIEIVSSPSDMATLEALLSGGTNDEITMVEDPSLANGQVYLRLGDEEREINMADVLAGIDQAVTGFFNETQRNTA